MWFKNEFKFCKANLKNSGKLFTFTILEFHSGTLIYTQQRNRVLEKTGMAFAYQIRWRKHSKNLNIGFLNVRFCTFPSNNLSCIKKKNFFTSIKR